MNENNQKKEGNNFGINNIKDSIADEIIKQMNNEIKDKQRPNLDSQNSLSIKDSNKDLNNQKIPNKNEIIHLNDKSNDQLMTQNNNLKLELNMKENYIISLNTTISRLKNEIELYNMNKDKYDAILNDKKS